MSTAPWVVDGAAANIWKRTVGAVPASLSRSPVPAFTRAANTTNASNQLTNLVTSDLFPGMIVAGAGIPAGTTITAVLSATSVQLSANASATAAVVLTLAFAPAASVAVSVEFGVDLKLGSSLPPTIRTIGIGPDDQAAGNVTRNRAIRVREKLDN